MQLLFALIDRFGIKVAVAALFITGLLQIAPWFFGTFFHVVIPIEVAHGVSKIANAVVIVVGGRIWVKSEAEKRIGSPVLPNTSVVPQIQNEIQKQEVAIATGSQPRPTNGK